jgi:hypothetical protein
LLAVRFFQDLLAETLVLHKSVGGDYIIGSEERLSHEIELLRGRLNAQIGDKYNCDKIRAAEALSAHLDSLLNRWYQLQAKKHDSR